MRAEAFKDYKLEEASQFEDNIRENRKELRTKKEDLHDLKAQCNRAKGEIDELKIKLDSKNEQK